MSTTNDNLHARAERTPCPLDWPCERSDLVDELCAALGDATDRIETLERIAVAAKCVMPPPGPERVLEVLLGIALCHHRPELLDHMPPEQAQAVRHVIAALFPKEARDD